ncbi:MAG: DnaJ domain-containing protein [Planctomycetes bacterium]|nr:DnaJ domain-containing protein [Planctomycetota bacterium]
MTAPNPFQHLGLPLRFDLSEADIRRAYLARVAAQHPDISSEDEAQEASATLNRARETLLNPETRADALLVALGGPAKDADKSLPPGFLMEIMQLREEIEGAVASGSPEQRAKWVEFGKQQRRAYSDRVRALFDASPTPALGPIRTTLNAWRYIERLIEQLDPAYDPHRADFPA